MYVHEQIMCLSLSSSHRHTFLLMLTTIVKVNIFIDSHGHIKIGDFGLATTELLNPSSAAQEKGDDHR